MAPEPPKGSSSPQKGSSSSRSRPGNAAESPRGALRRNPGLRGHPTEPKRGSNRANQGFLPPQRPMLKSREPWQEWPEMAVRITNLPPTTSTWDLWKRFEREGNITFIELYQNRNGTRDGASRIRFNPPPHRAFWSAGIVNIPTPDGRGAFQANVVAEPNKRLYQINSPIQKDRWYPETMSLHPSTLAFGFMYDTNTMMDMYEAKSLSRNDISFKVDLLRSRVVVNFPLSLTKPEAGKQASVPKALDGEFDRLNRYMFTIPFAQLQKISRTEINPDQWALVISLDSPPMFFRKRLDPRASHSQEALVWSEFDTWYRQTDIVYDPNQLKTAVTALKKDSPFIDLGRWTTYRFVFDNDKFERGLYNKIKNAFQDFNVEDVFLDDFKTTQGESMAPWSIIDPPLSYQLQSDIIDAGSHSESPQTLPFAVRYQLEVCLSQGVFNEQNISSDFMRALARLVKEDPLKARQILEYYAEKETRVFDPMSIFSNAKALAYSSKSRIPHYCVQSRKATVTPTMIYFSTPTVETSNRVIRKYAEVYGDRFLRVQFTDERLEGRINSCADKSRNDEIFTRVFRTLLNGIRIGDRHYQFLAFGNSQFRENGAYFFCPTQHLTCADIRQWMGDFTDIKVVAKYAARLGLCFSTTRAIHSSGIKILSISDVERNGYCFTDGVGKISEFLASRIVSELNIPPSHHAPCTFQFRMGGAKGILVTWPDVKYQEIHIRKSQSKFRAIYNGLEIIRCSRYSPATLNRQTIIILSALGVPDDVFNKLLSEQLGNYKAAMGDKTLALDLLGRYVDDNHMTMNIAAMILNGFMEVKEPFLLSLLHLWRAWSIKLLKEKARIIIENGAFLLGVTDESGTLRGHTERPITPGRSIEVGELPQIFVQVPSKSKKDSYVVIEGICLLGRNPSLFPGDIRVVQAVNVPALHHLRDVIVFSQKGERDVPSMCSGGDLDGDDFFCIWDKELTPLEWNASPMNYTAPKPKELNRLVEIQDVMKFFVRFMKNDALPTIAHAHLAQSDFLEDGVKNTKCLELAALHSKAVDYVKTGEPAEMPKRLQPRRWPHFMEKKYRPKEQIYHSKKVLGQLYDKVESVNFVPQYEASFDERILGACSPDDTMLKTARQIKSAYDTAVRRVMAQHEIQTEFEIWSTFVLSKPRVGSDYKMQEDMAVVSDALKDRFRRDCTEKAGGSDFKVLKPFVVAMYQVTQEEMNYALNECHSTKVVGGKEVPKRKMEPKFMPLMSFPWLFSDILGRIATKNESQGALESLGLTRVSPKNESKRSYKSGLGFESCDSEDFIETVDGVTHRGELLDLFRPDDVDSEGDCVEQPHEGSRISMPSLDGLDHLIQRPHLTVSPLQGMKGGEEPWSEEMTPLTSLARHTTTKSMLVGSDTDNSIEEATSLPQRNQPVSNSLIDLDMVELSSPSPMDSGPPSNYLTRPNQEKKIKNRNDVGFLSGSLQDLQEMVSGEVAEVEEFQATEEVEENVILDSPEESPLEKLNKLINN